MFSKKRSIDELLQEWRYDEELKQSIVHWQTLEGRPAQYAPFPEQLHPSIEKALQSRGIEQLYTHQRDAFDHALNGQSFTAVTPTASGKSYCYHLPVLQKVLEDSSSRALYLFPTKALAQDQKSDLNNLIEAMDEEILSYTYDGDTAPAIRQKIRKAGHIVITNPDMLHSGILPHHTKWVSLFENLKYIVIDELHTYKGVFGSHVAHVIRRLKRICAFYGSDPIFICTSATIKNPKELAEKLTNTKHELISKSGAPVGKKTFIFYNPPIVHPTFGVRRSAILEVRDLATRLFEAGIQSIVFAKSRVRVEMLVTYLKGLTKNKIKDESIRGYRGGYLPTERREIEKGLRDGEIQIVVSTNALELGVDIGQLQACIMTGYPGNIASAWQQAGRAGRRQDSALIIYVAASTALDQYVVNNPMYLLGSSPEEALINPENILILMDHLKCAAFELPFSMTETYGEFEVQELLAYLEEEGILVKTSSNWYWMSERFPAHDISLRSAAQENVVIVDQTIPAATKVIGEMDTYSAMTLLHEEAIYLHQGTQFQVEKLDWEEKKAYVREVDVDYFTDANLAVELKVMSEDLTKPYKSCQVSYGDVSLLAIPTIFKKIKFSTHENIGSGPIHLPPHEMHTNATWLTFDLPENWSEEMLTDSLTGVAYAMQSFVPLFIQCDRSDLSIVPQVKAVHNKKPTLFIYDSYPGGIGLSEKVYDIIDPLLRHTYNHVYSCPCQHGCPSCIGAQDLSSQGKEQVLKILTILMNESM
ncbi:DEAD/DEAH box helicase domain-containing protein [Lysinibacillus composti]|uniref:DEAD/DEAH box helicase n=1 Tax=Lysinibacillus composti TaxID=720633 RepID=A0A3N9UDB8_9BACI|nr:DEAD/DEAH box helicase [Lysinibacillus composti]MBM7609332.1 DEAD/DEAH box helicase domain-containing protein [Lysinibacillus composti]RQW74277.1 DEAD/DEAH box helicase [Lysinibacillus composti]